MKCRILLLIAGLLISLMGYSQVTTSRIDGVVDDVTGETLIGATVTATHVPTGTVYGTTTRVDGGYTLPNLRIGGPYAVNVSYIGYQNFAESDIYLQLGQKYSYDYTLQEEATALDEVVVVADRTGTLSGERTGAETSISREQLNKLPSINRSADDFTRLTPSAAEGGSFAGRNDQFNNYSLDGSIFNNPFGLDAATPGGQTAAQPVSLDAIEQINVSIAPFDVTQSGFTGASINSVTKSGTNQFHGTVYGFFRNSDLIGGSIDGEEIFKGDLTQSQTGFSLGGPIAKNKAFFFVNFELENRSDLGSFFFANDGTIDAGNESRVSQSDMQMVKDLLMQRYSYDAGIIPTESSGFQHDADNYKGLIKFDINLSQSHILTAKYNFLDAFRDLPAHPSALGRRGPDFLTLQFQNAGYRINNIIHQGLVELKSFFGNSYSNKFQAGYSAFRDSREPFTQAFPVVNVGKDGIRYIVAGQEPFSIHNVLEQDVYQVRNDFSIYLNKHSITVGAAYERFEFNNSFNLGVYNGSAFAPDIDINNLESFITSGELDATVQAASDVFASNGGDEGVEGEGWALAETNLGQISFYVQDEINATDKLSLTLGLRIDIPQYFNTPEKTQESIDRNCCYDPSIEYFDENGQSIFFDQTVFPSKSPLWNPRLGFNYDIHGDRSAQIRGGTGLFTGRFPFVWVGNQVANPNFFFYTVTDPDFKFPQIWRTNLGYDTKVGKGWVLSTDFIYTRDVNAQIVNNFGLKSPSGSLQGVDNRPYYLDSDRALVFGAPTNAYVFTNSANGNSVNWTLKAEKSWKNTYATLAYNYLNAKDAASIDAEISSDAYDRNPANILNTNQAEIAPSLYGNRHKILGSGTHSFNYGAGKWGTTLGLYFEYIEGRRFSYTYNGDLNRDGSGLNDLLYIPTDAEIDQQNFGDPADRASFKNYIAQDDYLSSRRGQYTEKYGALSPWYSTWDIRILQDFHINNDHSIQFSWDILNFGNLLSSSWGVRQIASSTALAQPVAVSVGEDGIPTYTFSGQTTTFFNDFSRSSRWQMQFGLRYSF